MDLQGETHAITTEAGAPSWASLVAYPDVRTLQPYHGEPLSARCLVDLYTADGTPVTTAPRQALRRVLDRGAQMGLEASIGLELEFYLLSDLRNAQPSSASLTAGRQVYRMHSSRDEQSLLAPLHRQMAEAGIGVEAFCGEDGPGQFEVILDRAPALQAADAAFTVRSLVKEEAARRGLTATFLSRPLADHSGSGAHIHQSLWSGENPLFRLDTNEQSSVFWSYLSGQLRYFPDAAAFYLPTINAYKRILLRQPAPICIDWAYEDRSAAIRVLGAANGRVRIENRAVAGEANPYLSVAAALATGFEGVQHSEDMPTFSRRRHGPGEEVEAAGESLPRSLADSLVGLSRSHVLRDWLGADLIDAFIAIKQSEVRRFEAAVTDWELREYLPEL